MALTNEGAQARKRSAHGQSYTNSVCQRTCLIKHTLKTQFRVVTVLFSMGLAAGTWRHHGGCVSGPCWFFCSCMSHFPLQVQRTWEALQQQQIVPSAELFAPAWNPLQSVECLALASVVLLQWSFLTHPLLSFDKSHPAHSAAGESALRAWGEHWLCQK